MPERVTSNRLKEFVACLEELGGASGNRKLRDALQWDEEFYWRVQGRLVSDGKIVPGRGQGGSVRLTIAETEPEPLDEPPTELGNERKATPNRKSVERPLYKPIKTTIETRWIERFGFDDVLIEETHSQGSKLTGGTFTRPDITAAGVRTYVFLPKRLEIITFEIKPKEAVGIMGVLEAVAHREAAHRSYVMFAISRAAFESSAEAERIFELAQKYGIGLVLTEDPSQVETWEIVLDAIRHEPDPARLDRFLGDLPSETMKRQLHKWKT
jgi:hypothetical protein